MPIIWSDKEVLERLFIATLASFDNKININDVARLYGGDMTYHALENRMRKWKKEATALKDEAAGREGAAKSPARPGAKKGGASPTKGAVKTGQVTKKKAIPTPKIKPEPPIDDEELLSITVEEVVVGGDEAAQEELDEFI